jgi:hypothetical protein
VGWGLHRIRVHTSCRRVDLYGSTRSLQRSLVCWPPVHFAHRTSDVYGSKEYDKDDRPLESYVFEWDGTNVTVVPGPAQAANAGSFHGHLLPLPSGQILYTDRLFPGFGVPADVSVFTLTGTYNPAWRRRSSPPVPTST